MGAKVAQPDDDAAQLFTSTDQLLDTGWRFFTTFFRSFRKKGYPKLRRKNQRKHTRTWFTGRTIRTIPFRKGDSPPAFFPTLKNAIQHGHYRLDGGRFRIESTDIMGWERSERESLTLILAVDLSRSTYPFKSILTDILVSLRVHFSRNNDRIGLISLQGQQAKILNHPTNNHRVVLKNLSQMKIHGMTPLADGLAKALDTARLESTRNPGSRCIVMVFSDCYPEPLTHQYDDLMDEPAYQQAIKTAALYRGRKIPLIIIAPRFGEETTHQHLPGPRLARRLVQESRGQYIELATVTNTMTNTSSLQSKEKNIEAILTTLEHAFNRSQFTGRSEQHHFRAM